MSLVDSPSSADSELPFELESVNQNTVLMFESLFLPRVAEFILKETIKECVFCWNYKFYL